jgi:hypothetical protein
LFQYGNLVRDGKLDRTAPRRYRTAYQITKETVMNAKQMFESFKTAKADGSRTNQEIVTAYNKLYEKQRVEAKVGALAQQMVEKDAEIARLKAALDGKITKAKAA